MLSLLNALDCKNGGERGALSNTFEGNLWNVVPTTVLLYSYEYEMKMKKLQFCGVCNDSHR